MIIVLKKKKIFIAVAVVLIAAIIASCAMVFVNVEKANALTKKTIVLDAGHGGVDKGVVGKNGTVEAEKNLEIAKKLYTLLTEAGYNVVMTRENDDGLYDSVEKDFKKQDFKKRKEIIEKAEPDMVLSIHCNKFPSSNRRGAQTFFNKFSDNGKILANLVQESLNGLNSANVGKTYSALSGDYFMLNCTSAPSAIVECGFLSNADDEQLLNDDKYVSDLVYAIYDAVTVYFES
jgi:N-acetylmuramoyl-L-alanine amidase